MNQPNWYQKLISTNNIEKINQKIKSIETSTSAEIVTVIANRSSTISHLRLTLFLLFTILGFALYFVFNIHEQNFKYENFLYYLFPIVNLVLTLLMCRLNSIQRLLIPKMDRLFQVQSRSELEFYIQRINMTRSKTGVLIYLSLMERQAVVLADKSIAERFPANTWQEIVDVIVKGIHGNNISEGILNGLDDCKARLAEHFPIEKNDINELPNQVIFRTNP